MAISEKTFLLLVEKVPPIIQFLAGFLTAIYAEPIRRCLFKPNLILNFSNSDEFIVYAPEKEILDGEYITLEAYCLRGKVLNTKNISANDCKAYLIDIEKQDTDGKFQSTIYCDSIPLAWSYQSSREQYESININKGVNQFFDIVKIGESAHGDDVLCPQIKVIPLRYEKLFKEQGVFRFSVQITSSNADPRIMKLILEWGGVWDKVNVRRG